MELNRRHRSSLISKLAEANEELAIQNSILERATTQKKNQEMIDSIDIRIFLLKNEIELIEKALINNEIDY